ncbi:MAG TPA: phosphoribosylanthranilate isomerase [Bryobacteraceae bacterium]|nr:phosphoribosylanthranilate isomerase [Bryobacteraceae bacterium]
MILKICGITNQDDASAAIDAGATAVGLNFYRRSPRYIAPERAAEIATAVGVRRVGVFVNERREVVEAIVRAARLDVAQLHGDETSGDYPAAAPVWKAIRVSSSESAFGQLRRHDLDPAEALLLDGPASGVRFEWTVAKAARALLKRPHRIILAGGLDSSNVAEAIAVVRPWGVDVCSRIEIAPGKKDHKKMTEFLQAAMAAALV